MSKKLLRECESVKYKEMAVSEKMKYQQTASHLRRRPEKVKSWAYIILFPDPLDPSAFQIR